jgi:hypothetical protein
MRDHTKLRAFEPADDIAHDFNNIIQFISGFAEFLLLNKKEWAKRRMTMKKINRYKDTGPSCHRTDRPAPEAQSRLQPPESQKLIFSLNSPLKGE